MRDALYHFIVGVLDMFLWGGDLEGEENLPGKGPAVFVANHLDATGPIACCCSLPMRVYPWSVADIMDPAIAADYLNKDFSERILHLKPPLSFQFSRFLARLTVPMFHSLGCIPVYKGDYERMQETLSLSMNLLRQDLFLLIFPEDPNLEPADESGIKPFQHTFVRLAELYHSETGKRLAFHPLAIHQEGIIQVGEAVLYNPFNKPGLERQRIKNLVEDEVHRLYKKNGGFQGVAGTLTLEG